MGDVEFLVDTGPLVAYLDRSDSAHGWAAQTLKELPSPLVTCEAVITEALFLLRNTAGGSEGIFKLLSKNAVTVIPMLPQEHQTLARLIRKYRPDRMDFADACLVHLSEMYPKATVVTLDQDFLIYRRNHRQMIPVLIPQQK